MPSPLELGVIGELTLVAGVLEKAPHQGQFITEALPKLVGSCPVILTTLCDDAGHYPARVINHRRTLASVLLTSERPSVQKGV